MNSSKLLGLPDIPLEMAGSQTLATAINKDHLGLGSYA
jgi:hypothetical protein